jgi:ATP-binding cassette subfamily F protein 3
VLALEKISKEYGTRTLFRDLNFQFPEAQRLALVGPNGVGKSTLLDIIVGQCEPSSGRVLKSKQLSLGYLPQLPNPQPAHTIIDECISGAEELSALQVQMDRYVELMSDGDIDAAEKYAAREQEFRNRGGYELPSRAAAILAGLGFADLATPTLSLSGGWRMRLELAKIFLKNPDVLLLDEPTNHLDLPSLAWVEAYLQEFSGTLIFVSHDRPLLNRLATGVIELRRERMRYFVGNFDDYLEQRTMREEELQARKAQLQEQQKHLQGFIDRFGAKASKARQAQSRAKLLSKLQSMENDLDQDLDRSDTAMSIKLPKIEHSGRMTLQIKNLGIGYGERLLCRGISFEVERGSRIAVIGANGIGKSTFLKTIVGEIPALDGSFTWDLRAQISYFAQEQQPGDGSKQTLLQTLLDTGMGEPQARSLLGAMLFRGDDVYKDVRVLSGGERHRLGLCKLFVSKANVILLDEPTNHLDMSSVSVLIEGLNQYQGSILFVSHDRDFIDELCTHVLVMLKDGRSAIFHGKLADYQRLAAQTGFPDILTVHLDGTNEVEKPSAPSKASPNKEAPRRNEQKKADALLAKITGIEGQIALLEAQLNESDGADHQVLLDLSEKIAVLQRQRDEMEEQWMQASMNS